LSTLLVVDLLPCAHWVHPAEPVSALKDPAGQGMQEPPLGPECPAIHEQLVAFLLPTTEVECSGQSRQSVSSKKVVAPVLVEYMSRPHRGRHDVAEVTFENVPAAQKMHESMLVACVSLENVPTWHSLHEVEPLYKEYLPAAHTVHVVLVLAPVAPENVPAGHGVHVASTDCVTTIIVAPWYVPALQGRQSRQRLLLFVLAFSQEYIVHVPAEHGCVTHPIMFTDGCIPVIR